MLQINDYKFGKIVARTERSTVLLASNKRNSLKIAVKCYRIHSRASPEYSNILNEILILSKCSHQNIVKFYGLAEETHKDEVLNEDFQAIYLLMEPLEITLKEQIKKRAQNSTYFSFSEIKRLVRDLFQPFCFLEKEMIAHQDIKPANIMMNEEGRYKIVDVWTAKNLFGQDFLQSSFPVEGTLIYCSPEKIQALLKHQGVFKGNLFKCDVFSLGLVILHAATLKKIKGLNTSDENAKNLLLQRISEVEERYNKTLGSLLRLFLEIDCEKRKSFIEINEENFFELFSEESNFNGNFNNNPSSFRGTSPLLTNTFKKKGSFHSVASSDIQAFFPANIDPLLGTSHFDTNNNLVNTNNNNSFIHNNNNNSEIDGLLKDAEKHRKLGNYPKSIEIFEKCFKIKWQNPKPEDDLQTSSILSGLGNVVLELGNYKKGEELHEKALLIRRKILGENHKLTADSYNSLGVAFHGQEIYEKAVENFEIAMELYERLLGVNNKSTALAYFNAAGGHCLLGHHEKALELKRLVLEIRVSLYGENNEEVACVYDSLAQEYNDLCKPEEALKNRAKSLEIRKAIFGEKHAQTALSQELLAADYLIMKNFQKALELGQASLKIDLEVYGKNHLETAKCLEIVGESMVGVGDFEKGTENLGKALNIKRNLLGEEHEETLKTKKLLDEISIKLKLYS